MPVCLGTRAIQGRRMKVAPLVWWEKLHIHSFGGPLVTRMGPTWPCCFWLQIWRNKMNEGLVLWQRTGLGVLCCAPRYLILRKLLDFFESPFSICKKQRFGLGWWNHLAMICYSILLNIPIPRLIPREGPVSTGWDPVNCDFKVENHWAIPPSVSVLTLWFYRNLSRNP